jgi:hypothetical protein
LHYVKFELACDWKWENKDEEVGGSKQKYRYTSLRHVSESNFVGSVCYWLESLSFNVVEFVISMYLNFSDFREIYV